MKHCTCVLEEDRTVHGTPPMVTVQPVGGHWKEPVNVTGMPPYAGPDAGLTLTSDGVDAYVYVRAAGRSVPRPRWATATDARPAVSVYPYVKKPGGNRAYAWSHGNGSTSQVT